MKYYSLKLFSFRSQSNLKKQKTQMELPIAATGSPRNKETDAGYSLGI